MTDVTAQLTVTAGPNLGETFPVAVEAMLLLGRGSCCDVQLRDPAVSRTHCRIGFQDGEPRIVDAGSSSGTWVNGEKIGNCILRPGDQIGMGDTRLRFETAALSTAATVPPRKPAESDDSGGTMTPKPAVAEGSCVKSLRTSSDDLCQLRGRYLEGYSLDEIVARSSSGMVFRSTATTSGRTVAVKVFWPNLMTGEDDVRRVVRAVRTLQPMRHDNLVELIDGGLSGDRHCWCAAEWIDGETAEDAIGRIGIAGMLDWTYAIRVAHGVARALEALHEHQIVHRNILPGSVFVRSADGRVKLGDLILAKALDGAQSEKITRQGEIVGNLGYLAPEQLSGGDRADCRGDMYNLGATVYALLTGRPPFSGDSPADLIRAVQRDRPDPPTRFQLSIPPLLEGVILKMLSKRPDDRFSTPSRLVVELERVARYHGVDILR